MSTERLRRVETDPEFGRLVTERARLGGVVVGLMVAVYFGYIVLLAYAPGLLRLRISPHVTIGFPLGLLVLLITFLLVALYVGRSRSRLDALTAGIAQRSAR